MAAEQYIIASKVVEKGERHRTEFIWTGCNLDEFWGFVRRRNGR